MTSEEAMAAVGYLTRCFGGFVIPEDEKRGFLRLFVKFPVDVARDAIDALVIKSQRRPSPNELAQEMRRKRPAVADTRNPEPWPDPTPVSVSRHVAALKSLLPAPSRGSAWQMGGSAVRLTANVHTTNPKGSQ